MTELERALTDLVGELEREGIPFAVIGGLANLVWGEPRVTMDVDLSVDVREAGIGRLVDVSRRLGTPRVERPEEFADRARVLPIRTHGGTRVDLVLATLPFELDMILRASRVRFGSTEAPVCTAEDLIIQKSVSERARDHEDVLGVLRRQGDRLDLGRLDATLHGLAADLGEPEIADRWEAAKRAAGLGSLSG